MTTVRASHVRGLAPDMARTGGDFRMTLRRRLSAPSSGRAGSARASVCVADQEPLEESA